MANHVYFNIEVNTPEEQKFDEVMNKVKYEEPWGEKHTFTRWDATLMPIYDTPYDEDKWYDWGIENIGAKWIHIEDFDGNYMSGHSAWSPPIPMIQNLATYLGKATKIRMTYEDEFRNFIGVAYAYGDGDHDWVELEGEDLNQLLAEELGLEELPEDFEWWDEYEDTGIVPQEWIDDEVYNWFEKQ